MSGARILVVEDEAAIADVVDAYLRQAGYKVERAANGRDALQMWRTFDPDLIVLDLMIPGPNGIEVAKTVRAESDVAIAMLTAKVDEADRLEGLGVGADDYITKPFSPRELVLRVDAILRRAQGGLRAPRSLEAAGIAIDENGHAVTCHGSDVHLTPNQFALLRRLVADAGTAVHREALMDLVHLDSLDPRTVDVHVSQIRRKLGPCGNAIETVRGIGYRVRTTP